MKTKIILRTLLMSVIILIFNTSVIKGQTTPLDSVIHSKNLEFLSGTIPLHYSARCENRSKEVHSFVLDVAETYSEKGINPFKLKLAVIDSSQWSGFVFPYGFFFIHQGWIVIPGDVDFQKFSHLWGYHPFRDVLKKNLKALSNDPEELLVDVMYKFTVCHELGHYYTREILNSNPPDHWTSEWMASYFATDFLLRYDKEIIQAYDIFFSTFTNEVKPKFRSLSDFNRKYANVGLQNFVWYHSMFQPMIEDIYSAYQEDFMNLFARAFPHTKEPIKYSREEILEILDHLTDGKTSKWVAVMEGRGE